MLRDGAVQFVVFRLGTERFGIALSLLDEVIEAPAVQPLPDAGVGAVGVATVRGALVSVYDPRPILNAPAGNNGAALVFAHGGKRVAITVDDVDDAVTITRDDMRAAPGVNSDGIVLGVVWRDDDLIAVLDGAALLEAAMAVREERRVKADSIKLVTFRLGEALFAAEIHSVERVLRYTPPNAVPDAPDWMEGVIDHAGHVIPVVDLRRRIGLAECAITPRTRILVLSTSDGAVGAIVDAVLEVAIVATAAVTPPPPLFRGLSSRFVSGVAKIHDRLVVMLDVDRIVTSTDRLEFDASADAMTEFALRG